MLREDIPRRRRLVVAADVATGDDSVAVLGEDAVLAIDRAVVAALAVEVVDAALCGRDGTVAAAVVLTGELTLLEDVVGGGRGEGACGGDEGDEESRGGEHCDGW